MFMQPKDAWQATLGQLQIQLHEATFDTWVRDAAFVAFNDGVFTVGVPNAYAKDWLEQRLYRLLKRTLSSVVEEDISIEFIVQPPPPRKQQDFGPLLNNIPPAAAPTPISLSVPIKEKPATILFAQGEQLNADYSLHNFVMGNCNQLAHAAAMAITNAPGAVYNPLYICSGVGMGKTHLLHAIGNALSSKGLKVLYVNAETFTNDLIRAIRTQQTEAFREFYRTIDALVIDDIQFLAGKESTQEEFLHTFNSLYHRGCQVVLAGNAKPKTIDGLDERLSSRFEGGLTVELVRPDAQTRSAILQLKANGQDGEIPAEIAHFIAQRINTNIRDLEGALNQVLAHAALTRQPLTQQLAETVLQTQDPIENDNLLDLFGIIEATARYHQLTLDDLLSKQRSQAIAHARHIAIYLAREDMNASLPAIGRALGGRTHSTVISSYRKVADRVATDPAFRRDINHIRQHIHALLG